MGSFKGQKNINRKEAFWSKVDIKEDHECWNYKEYKDEDGYGRFWIGNTFVSAHRYAFGCTYSDKISQIPSNISVLHICDNPTCCNPMHLYLGTQLDNMRDRKKRGRNPLPERCIAISMLFYSGEIWLMRRLAETKKLSQAKIAKMFKCNQSTISRYCKKIFNSNKYVKIFCKEGFYV